MDPETTFFEGLIELQYGKKVVNLLKPIAQKISWAKGWPEDDTAFLNAEAVMWGRKIDREKRNLIFKELRFLIGGKNLDLGCGGYSYIPSTGFDFSSEMLKQNEQCTSKVQGDLEKKLPFRVKEFDSITAVFVLNYVRNYNGLLQEVSRVLKPKGIFVMVLYSGELNDWQKQKEVNRFSVKKWKSILKEVGFKVNFYEKGKMWFFKCGKAYLRPAL